jgi:hypothetical protein
MPSIGQGVFAAILLVNFPAGLGGQEFEKLVADCAAAVGGPEDRCHLSALALDAARGGLATAASAGSELPGSASTMGYRIQTSPRASVSARAGISRFEVPKSWEGYQLPFGKESMLVPSLHLSGTVALLNGLTLAPTVGGVLSLDLTASTHLLFPGSGDGFGGRVNGWGMAARLGILRESFTLPGVSLSAGRRWLDKATLGDMSSGDASELRFDPSVTSYRALVGKEILGVGLIAGAGLDQMSGKGRIRLRASPTGLEAGAPARELRSRRAVFFAGGSKTFLILQLSGEIGWSQAVDPPLPEEPGSGDYPSARAHFGALALRITF